MINKLIEFSIQNRWIVMGIAVVLVGVGIHLLTRLPVDVYPDLNAPVVTVITESHGMAPEDIETLITFPLESAFNSLPYVKRVRSNSTLGLSKITIEFEYGTDIYFARQLVTEKLQMMIPKLPDHIEPPMIGPISSMFADAIELTIEGQDLLAVRDFAEWDLKPRLQTVPGVSNVINMGGYVKQYHVDLDPNQMLNFGIHVHEVIAALKNNNLNSSGGFVEVGPEEKIIRGLGRIQSVQDIENIVLKAPQGIPITLGQIADVKIGAFVRRGSAGVSGKEVVIVTVQNQYQANVMKTIRGVNRVIENIKGTMPSEWSIKPFYNQLDMILRSIKNVSQSIIIGAVLVVFVLYLFLNNLRSTIIVAVAIPLSAIFSIVFFHLFDLSLNIMTLGGMAIGLGMIVDSSIIMTENIFRHIQEEKETVSKAVITGAKEVGRPIFFAIMILIAVFAPIFTLQGIEGKMFIPLIFSVSAAVLGSLLISLTLTPVFASFIFRKKLRKTRNNRFLPYLKTRYAKLLGYSLKHTKKMMMICGSMIIISIIIALFIGSEFMPEMDESSLLVDVLLPPETSLAESGRIASIIGQRITELPAVIRVVRATGKAKGAEHSAPVNLSHTNVVLVPKEERSQSIEEVKHAIREVTQGIPGVNIQINAPLQHRINHVITGIRSAIAVKIFGDNLNSLREISGQIHDIIQEIPGVTDLQIEQVSSTPQLQIQIDRVRLARYGLNVDAVSELIEVALNGTVATELIEARKRYEIFVRYQESFRNSRTQIANLLIETPSGYRIPISEIATITENANPSVVHRENALRRLVVQCNVTGRDMGSVARQIKKQVSRLDLPEGYFVQFGGTYENQIRAMRQLTVVVVITVLIVFALLAMSFHSVRSAFLIFINIPLALAGGILILFISGFTLSVPSIIGFIALIGIAVQDGIVLVSHIHRYRGKGLDVTEAVVKAGKQKMRPVLMTTFTTFLGLVPLALRNVTGSEIQKPLAVVIMFGLLFSTFLTLIVLPSLYAFWEEKRQKT